MAKDLTRRGSVDCITDIEQFKKSICEESVLELIAYSVNRKNFAEKEDIKNGSLFRFAAYRTFFGILELNGLGKGRRFRLPECVVTDIRKLYPSKSGKYVGFKAVNDQVAEKLNIY